jgi:hypothetical protein
MATAALAVPATALPAARAPIVRIDSHPKPVAQSSTARFRFAANRRRARYACSLDRHAYVPCTSPKTFSSLMNGAHMFAVKTSVAHVWSTPARYRWSVAVRPDVSLDDGPYSPTTSRSAVLWFSSGDEHATFRCSLDGSAPASCESPTTYEAVAPGSHVFAVEARDGGVTSLSDRLEWTVGNRNASSDPAALEAATSVAGAESSLRDFFDQYRLTLDITDIHPTDYAARFATWTPITENRLGALKAYGAALMDEWAKYPREWAAVAGVQGVALVDRLAVSGTNRAGMADLVGGVLYYDVGYGSGDYARESLHHELDHLLTYTVANSVAPYDPAWLALNPPGFHYGNGGASCYLPGNTCPFGPHAVVGFASGYATSAIQEDKAEVYGYLMETNDYHLLERWIVTDSYLAAKVARYEAFLCGLLPAFCGRYFDVING